jgi:hypothetical protein
MSIPSVINSAYTNKVRLEDKGNFGSVSFRVVVALLQEIGSNVASGVLSGALRKTPHA